MLLQRWTARSFAATRAAGIYRHCYLHARPRAPQGQPNAFNLSWRRSTRRSSTKSATKNEQKDAIDIPLPAWYHRLGPVSNFFTWFHRTQEKSPRLIQLCTTLVTYCFGDLLAQANGSEPYDPWRTMRMLTIGGLAALPGYRWFIWLGNHFNYPSKVLSIAVKVVVQQAVFTPIFNTYFFGMQAALTGISSDKVIERIQATVPTSIINSCKVWPAVTAITFAFIAPAYRFMFSGLFAICWQGYLSFLNRQEEKHQIVQTE